ncbi:hypothetical protein KAR91_06345 [Candidatus Pacearchaeota archaeon]|nr:hypothetical protein [Candidatus Pacearchaeota archaeon]
MPVELLVRNFDGPAGRAKGDIVRVKVSPAKWGKSQGPPNCRIVKIDNVDITTIDAFYHQRHKPIKWDASGDVIEIVRSWHRLDDMKLSESDKLSLEANELTLKYKDIATVFVDRTKEIGNRENIHN